LREGLNPIVPPHANPFAVMMDNAVVVQCNVVAEIVVVAVLHVKVVVAPNAAEEVTKKIETPN
jgi:hypothetical protein